MLSKSIATAFGIFAVLTIAIVGVAMTEDADAEIPETVDVTYHVGEMTYVVKETTVGPATLNPYITLSAPKVSIPSGYTFGGWADTAERAKSDANAVTTLAVADGATADDAYAILVPTTVPDAFTITYVVDGQADITVTIPAGTKFPVKLLTEGQFSAYGITIPDSKIFVGWYATATPSLEDEDMTEIKATTDVEDVLVYAVTIDNIQYTVTIDGKASKVWAGTVLDAPEAPAVEGKVFKCWMVGDKVAEFPMTVLDDVVITSVYEDAPAPEPAPVVKKDDSGMMAVLCIVGIVVIVGAGLFVWTLKKDKKN